MTAPTPDIQADIHAVEASLHAWHRALEMHDWTAAAAGLTEHFLMIEHDRMLDKAALMAFLVDSGARGRQRAALHGFRTQVERDCAWTTVYNDELWIANDGGHTPFSFLETAVFRLVNGAWRLARYHATRLPPSA